MTTDNAQQLVGWHSQQASRTEQQHTAVRFAQLTRRYYASLAQLNRTPYLP